MSSLAGLTIGSARKKVTIVGFEAEKFKEDDANEKVYIHTKSTDGAPFKVCEVWIEDYKKQRVAKGIWKNMDHTGKALLKTSMLAKLMEYLEIINTDDMIGKEVYVEPKDNGYMAIVLYE